MNITNNNLLRNHDYLTMEKISSMDPLTIRNYKIVLDNFENFCLEKHGKADCIPDLKESDLMLSLNFYNLTLIGIVYVVYNRFELNSIFHTNLAGLPITIELGGMSLVITEPIPSREFFPIFTPSLIVTDMAM